MLGIEVTVLSVIVQTILLFEHPLFQEKNYYYYYYYYYCISSIRTPTFEIIQYPNTYTLWSSNGEVPNASTPTLPNVYFPSKVSVELGRGGTLPNVYY